MVGVEVKRHGDSIARVGGFALAISISTAVLVHFHDRFWWPPDEGAYAHVADRIVRGQILNAEIQDIHFGYVNFANALALRLFGSDLVSLRYPLAFMTCLQSCLIYAMLLPRGVVIAFSGALAMTSFSFVQFLNPTAHWYCLFFFTVLLSVLQFVPHSRGRTAIAGFLVSTVFQFRQLTGVLLALGVVGYLLYQAPKRDENERGVLGRVILVMAAAALASYLARKSTLSGIIFFGLWPVACLCLVAWKSNVSNRHVLRTAAWFTAGAVVALLPLSAYHLAHASVESWMQDTVRAAFSVTELDFIHRVSYWMYSVAGVRGLAHASAPAGLFNGIFWMLLPWFPLLLGVEVCRRLSRAGTEETMGPLPFLATYYSIVSLHYQIPIYLFYSLPVVVAGLLSFVPRTRIAHWLAAGLICGLSAVGLYYHAGQPLERKAIRGVRVPLVLNDAFPRARLWMSEQQRRTYSRLLETIEREVPVEGTIFAFPNNCELYFLAQRKNPFRFFNSALALYDPQQVQQVQQTIEREPPTLVFYQPADKYNTSGSRKLAEFVRARYELMEVVDGIEVYRHRAR